MKGSYRIIVIDEFNGTIIENALYQNLDFDLYSPVEHQYVPGKPELSKLVQTGERSLRLDASIDRY